ncbi:MAG: hypothetical protein Pars2KO_29120 [Parasphingorhabdus sp.]
MRDARGSDQAFDRPDGFNIAILAIRLTGASMILGGIAISLGIGDLFIPEVGFFIIILGLFEMLAVPAILVKVRNRRREDFLAGKHSGNRE